MSTEPLIDALAAALRAVSDRQAAELAYGIGAISVDHPRATLNVTGILTRENAPGLTWRDDISHVELHPQGDIVVCPENVTRHVGHHMADLHAEVVQALAEAYRLNNTRELIDA